MELMLSPTRQRKWSCSLGPNPGNIPWFEHGCQPVLQVCAEHQCCGLGLGWWNSSMPAVIQVPGCTAKMGARQSSFSPVEIDLACRSFDTEMGSGLSGSMKRVGERVGARMPASSHTWLSPRALPGCCLSSPIPGVFVSLGMMQRTKWGWVERRLVISLLRFSCRADTGAEGLRGQLCFPTTLLFLSSPFPPQAGREQTLRAPYGMRKGQFPPAVLPEDTPSPRAGSVPGWEPWQRALGWQTGQMALAGFAVPQRFAVPDASQVFVGKALLQRRAKDTGLSIFLVQSSVLSALQFQCWCPHCLQAEDVRICRSSLHLHSASPPLAVTKGPADPDCTLLFSPRLSPAFA